MIGKDRKDRPNKNADYICDIDIPEFPSVSATLEYRRDNAGHIKKYMVLNDATEGFYEQLFYVGDRFSRNRKCVERARYIISIYKLKKGRDDEQKGEER